MNASEKIRIIAKRKNISLSVLAEMTGQSRQNFSNKMSRGDFKESELSQIAEKLGLVFDPVFKDKDGNIVP